MLTTAAVLFLCAPANAQRLDLAAMKCKDFLANKPNIELVLMWLEGYYSEENASPIVDFEKMKQDAGKISDFCGKNPDNSVIDAAEVALGK